MYIYIIFMYIKVMNKTLRYVVIFLSLILFIIGIFNITLNTSFSHKINLSNDVIDKIYLDNNYLHGDLTKESLFNIQELVLDAKIVNDFSFLSYCNNLSKLTINNFEYLSNNNYNYVKKLSNIKELYINIDGNYILKNTNYKIDVSNLNVDKVYINSFNTLDEINAYLSYSLIKDTAKNDNYYFINEIDISSISSWNNEINNIIKSLNITNDTELTIKKIVNYITNKFTYDELSLLNNKVYDYNEHLLSSSINSKNAICCNYTALANILFYETGIESYYISGTYIKYNHAFNYINYDGNYYFIDLTALDNGTNYLNKSIDHILFINNINYKNYKLPVINNVKTTEEETVTNYNLVFNYNNFYNDIVLSLCLIVISLVIIKIFTNKKYLVYGI